MKKKNSIIIAIMILLNILSACGVDSSSENAHHPDNNRSNVSVPLNGNEADAAGSSDSLLSMINTVTLAGESIAGTDFAGEKLTMLNIWATWCPPCVAELPHLQEISLAYADRGVRVVGVMQDGVNDKLELDEGIIETGKELLTNAGAEYIVILPDTVLMMEFIEQMQYFPTTFFLDADGKVIKTVIGSRDVDGWRQEIDEVLAEIS